MTKNVLILGASGRFGRNAAEAFWNAGWTVQQFDRSTDRLADKAATADVIVNGWNPSYDRWADEVPSLTEQVVAAAKVNQATVILPGNVYVYGETAPEVFGPGVAHSATNPLGLIRINMEAAYRDAGVKTIVLRAGDFIDTEASGNWFDAVITKHIGKGNFVYPGDTKTPHSWAFLPDLARAAVLLAEKRHNLSNFEDVAFPGYCLTGTELAGIIEDTLGRRVRTKRFNWLALRLARPFWPMAKHLLEMRYLWNKPHALDGSAFTSLLPDFVPTPASEAISRALGSVNVHPDQSMAGSHAFVAQ